MAIKFDIVIPTLDLFEASYLSSRMQRLSVYSHNYIIVGSDVPTGYTDPCNRGARAGNAKVVAFVNDDIQLEDGWDLELVEEMGKGTYCFGPWTPDEDNMRINGWFLCLRRDYIEHYGYAFDPLFRVWCGDIDLIRRLELDDIEPVLVPDVPVTHEYSKTCNAPHLQEWITKVQVQDIRNYWMRWGTDPNIDKCKKS